VHRASSCNQPTRARTRSSRSPIWTANEGAVGRLAEIEEYDINWSGPIGQFHLTVDKGEAGSLLRFCGQGVKKAGDTRFEMSKTNSSPDGDLAVLILKKMPTQ
jgi:hypothetical protein